MSNATLVEVLNGTAVVSATNPFPVTATVTPSGTQDVNITKVGGSAVSAISLATVNPTIFQNAAPTAAIGYVFDPVGLTVAKSVVPYADNISSEGLPANALMGYDGTNFDRIRTASAQVSGGMSNTGMIAAQIFARTDDSNVSAPAALNGNTDTNGTTVTGLATVSKSLTYDQVGNNWVRERYPSISTTNSSTAALGGGAVFTGTSVNVQGYGSATITVISNVASATNGLSIQQSSDGTNWDITDPYTVAAGVVSKINVPRQAVFLRVVYTNGAGAQASFRLQTLLNTQMPTASSIKPVDGMSLENDFAGVLAVGGLSSGSVINVSKDIVGALATGAGTTAVAFSPANVTPLTGTAITFAASGDNTVIAAVASQTTKVFSIFFTVAGATTITIKNGAGASLTGAMTLSTGGSFTLDMNTMPWFTTSVNTAFIINSSAAVQVSGRVYSITSV